MTIEDKEWIESSVKSGEKYGYPKCCVDAFISQPPSKINSRKKPSPGDVLRFKMGHIDGKFSGFVPCLAHAKMIEANQVTLEELIEKEKRTVRLPFPYDWSHK